MFVLFRAVGARGIYHDGPVVYYNKSAEPHSLKNHLIADVDATRRNNRC